MHAHIENDVGDDAAGATRADVAHASALIVVDNIVAPAAPTVVVAANVARVTLAPNPV